MAERNKAQEMAGLAIAALQDKKGEDLRVIDISKVSTLGDYFIIASGGNARQVQAMIDAVDEKLGRAGFEAKSVEGYEGGRWVLMDFGDIIIHVFDQENRRFYDLERIWRDGETIPADSFVDA
ncbi:MAG: ribosome silencing factor [Butyrivibrio sp.]|nr:ribosome silencing factor [Butyrivibrio sp.]